MTAYGEVERELAVLLRRARAWNRDLATEVHRDLQPTAYALLSRIEEQVSLRASDLSDYYGIDKGPSAARWGCWSRSVWCAGSRTRTTAGPSGSS